MLKRITISAALAVAGGLTVAGPTVLAAQDRASQNTSAQQGRVDPATETFVKQAASDGLMEVRLGQLAQETGSSDTVKRFGERMIQDHTRANEALMKLAAQKGITPPSELMPEHRKLLDKLQGLSGEEFDRAYLEAMVKDHSKAVEEFERQTRTGTDPDIQAFADKNLPVLRQHLQMAQQASDRTVSGAR